MTHQVSATGNSAIAGRGLASSTWNRMVGARANSYTMLQEEPIAPPPPLSIKYDQTAPCAPMPITSRTTSMFVAPIETYDPRNRTTPYDAFRRNQADSQRKYVPSEKEHSGFNAAIYQLWIMQQLQVAGRGGLSERPWSNITMDDVRTLRELSQKYGYDSIGYILAADGTVFQWTINPLLQLMPSGTDGIPLAIGKFHRNGDFVPVKQPSICGSNREYEYDRVIPSLLIRTWNAANGWGTDTHSTKPQSFWCWRKK